MDKKCCHIAHALPSQHVVASNRRKSIKCMQSSQGAFDCEKSDLVDATLLQHSRVNTITRTVVDASDVGVDIRLHVQQVHEVSGSLLQSFLKSYLTPNKIIAHSTKNYLRSTQQSSTFAIALKQNCSLYITCKSKISLFCIFKLNRPSSQASEHLSSVAEFTSDICHTHE